MKISQVIAELEKSIKEYGDIECIVHDGQGDDTDPNPVTRIVFRKDFQDCWRHKPKFDAVEICSYEEPR